MFASFPPPPSLRNTRSFTARILRGAETQRPAMGTAVKAGRRTVQHVHVCAESHGIDERGEAPVG